MKPLNPNQATRIARTKSSKIGLKIDETNSSNNEDLSLNETAYQALKNALITLVYKPGEYLNTALLMEHFGLGRTPVQHALHRLSAEGLIQIIPRKGAVATPLSIQDALELIEVRLVNEMLCLRLATASVNDFDIEQLEALAQNVSQAAQERNMTELMNADRLFHEHIASITRNATLADILSVLHAKSQRFWAISLSNQTHIAEVLEEHQIILNALKNRNSEAAEQAAKQHILSFKHSLMNVALR